VQRACRFPFGKGGKPVNSSLLILLVVSPLLLSALSRRRVEEVCAPYVCALLPMLYILALFRALPLFPWLLLAAVCAGLTMFVVRCVRHGARSSLREAGFHLLTPGLLVLALMATFFALASRDHVVHATDDLYYWAIEAHSIFAHDGLVNASLHIAPRFMDYTPGMQLWDWLGLTVAGEWNEAVLYLMLWLFYAALLAPLTRGLRWRTAWLAPLAAAVLVCLPTVFNRDAYDMLRVDTTLGLLTGYALMQVYLLMTQPGHGRWETACLALALTALVLVKQAGAAWCVLAVLPLLLHKRSRRRGLRACVIPALVFVSWRVACSVLSLHGQHAATAETQFAAMRDGSFRLPAHLGGVVWQTLTRTDFWFGGEGSWLTFPPLVWCVLLAAALCWLSRSCAPDMRRAVRIWAPLAIGLFVIGYAAILSISLFANSSPDSSLYNLPFMRSLTERYGCPLPMGLFLLVVFWLLELRPSRARAVAAACAAGLVLLCAHWPSMHGAFDGDAYNQAHQTLCYDTEAAENFWISDLDDERDAVVLYATAYPPYVQERLQYVAAPHKLVVRSDESMSDDAFRQLLMDSHITHLVCMDEENGVYEAAMRHTEDEWLDVVTVYVVEWIDGEPCLSYL